MLLMVGLWADGLPNNSPDVCHGLVPRVIVGSQPQTLLIHLHHCGWKTIPVPAATMPLLEHATILPSAHFITIKKCSAVGTQGPNI
jgi:hypothetical protein